MATKQTLKRKETTKPTALQPAATEAAPAPTRTAATATAPAPQSARAQAFELDAPQAASVLLAGDFTGWQAEPIQLKKDRDGRWKITVSLAPGTYQYRFMVDGVWVDDPRAQARVANPFGSANCVRQVSAN